MHLRIIIAASIFALLAPAPQRAPAQDPKPPRDAAPKDAPTQPTAPAKGSDPFEGLGDDPKAPIPDSSALELPPVESARFQQDSDDSSAAPPRDLDLQRVQVPGRNNGTSQDNLGAGSSALASPAAGLPPAREPLGGTPSTGTDAPPGSPFVLPAERLPLGPSTVALDLQVGAPEFANLNLESSFWIKVTNKGSTDALGVVARYELPRGVEYIDSEPVEASNNGGIVTWHLSVVPAGSEKIIKVKVRPLTKGAIDHAVTLAVLSGSRARSMVRQPDLRVDIRPSKPKPLKGDPVVFDIDVSNVGDHPARDVMVQAVLSPGLRHSEGQELKLSLKREMGVDAIAPGNKVSLKLEVDTAAMGEQSCDVTVTSRDLTEPVRKGVTLDVVYPNVTLEIIGPPESYPGTRAKFLLKIANTGNASARKVRIAAKIPEEVKAISADPRPEWDPIQGRMDWSIAELHPGDERTFTIDLQMLKVGAINLYAGTKFEGLAESIKTAHKTDVRGIPKLVLTVTEPRGAFQEGEESTFEIRIRNDGSKEATGLLVGGKVSRHLQIIGLESADPRSGNPPPQPDGSAVFPLIDKLPPRGEVSMTIRVKAVEPGDAVCQVSVRHDDFQGEGGPSQSVVTKITASHAGTGRTVR